MSRVCGVGIRFVLDLHGISRDDVAQKLNRLCNKLYDRMDERCWCCKKDLPGCIVAENSVRLNDNKTYFYSFQLFDDRTRGWIMEYQINSEELFFRGTMPKYIRISKSDMITIAKKVSNSLGYVDRSLLPFPYIESWDDR